MSQFPKPDFKDNKLVLVTNDEEILTEWLNPEAMLLSGDYDSGARL
jgi:hypothetical protein